MHSKLLAFFAASLLAVNRVDAACRSGFCDGSVNGDFTNQDATPAEWTIRAKEPWSDVELHSEYPGFLTDGIGAGAAGSFLKVQSHPESATIVVHSNIRLPLDTPEPYLFRFRYIVPAENTVGMLRLIDERGRVYYRENFAAAPAGQWVSKAVRFTLHSPSVAIRWRIDVSSNSEACKLVIFNFINICASQNGVPSEALAGENLLPPILPGPLNRTTLPWYYTAAPIVTLIPYDQSQVQLPPRVKLGGASISTTLSGLSPGSCYLGSGLIDGTWTIGSFPLIVTFDAQEITSANFTRELQPLLVGGAEWSKFTLKLCTSQQSPNIKYQVKNEAGTRTLWRVDLRPLTCAIRQIARRSFSAHDEL